MSCLARSYPRAEFEYDAKHEYDFDKKSSRKVKKASIEEAFSRATRSYLHFLSNFKAISFEDFTYIHSNIYKRTLLNSEGKLPDAYKSMYNVAERLSKEYDDKVSDRAKKFIKWLESENGKYFIDAIREERNVKRRLLLSNMLASYYINMFYPYTINGAVEKYLRFEYEYAGRYIYKAWASPLFWGAFGIGMVIYEEIQRIKKVNDHLRFVVEDDLASEVFITEMKTWLDATNNLTDFNRQWARAVNSLREFFTSGQFISTIAGDVGSAVVADLIRRGVVIALESLGFLLLNFTVAGRVARGVLGLAEFVKRSVLSFLGFQIFVEWPIDGVIQIWLNRYLERIFDTNFNPNRQALTEQEIEELRKNKNIPDKWGGLTKYEWAELWKLLKALYFGEIYLTKEGRRRLTELLDKADAKYVYAMILRLRSIKALKLWRKELIEKFKNANKKVQEGFVDCKAGDFSSLSDVKLAIRDIVNTVNKNTDFSGVVLPANFDDNQANIKVDEYDHFSGSMYINQYVNSGSYHYSYAYELGSNTYSSTGCSFCFSFSLARWVSGAENGLAYRVTCSSYNLQNHSKQVYATNYYLLDLVNKLAHTNAIEIRDAKIVKKQGMYYLLLRANSLSSYRLINGKLRKKTRKTHYLIPLSEVVGYGHYFFKETHIEHKTIGNSSSLGLRPDPQKADRFHLANFSILISGWYFDNNAVTYLLGHHASRGKGSSKGISYYEDKEKSVFVNCELIFNPDTTDKKKRVFLRLQIEIINRHIADTNYWSNFVHWRETENFVNYFPKVFVRGEVKTTCEAKDFTIHDLDIEDKKTFEIPLASELTDEEISNYFDPPSIHRDYYDVPEPYSDSEFPLNCFLSI
ncbi:MAG: hypothetical protein QXT86_13640 [Archaeoglobaceae archaeon]